MNKGEKKDITDIINKIKVENISELLLVGKYSLEAYINSVLTFGFNSKATKETINIWCCFLKILNEEKFLHYTIIKNLSNISAYETYEFLDYLDYINEETIGYIYQCLDDVIDACLTNKEYRINHLKKNFNTLIETDEYRKKLSVILISKDMIYSFLQFNRELIEKIEINAITDNNAYGCYIKINNDHVLEDIVVVLPDIFDLESANNYLYTIYCAYGLNDLINTIVDDETINKFNNDAEILIKEFNNLFYEKQKTLLKK